jgi:hypothetical protein
MDLSGVKEISRAISQQLEVNLFVFLKTNTVSATEIQQQNKPF